MQRRKSTALETQWLASWHIDGVTQWICCEAGWQLFINVLVAPSVFCDAMPLSALFLGLHAMETPLCTCCLRLAPPALCPRHRHSHFCILWDLSQEEASSRLCVSIIVMSCCRLASLSLPEATTVLPGLLSNFIPFFLFFYFFITSTHNELIICRQCHIYHRPPVMSVHTKPMKVKSALSVYLFSLFVCVFRF